MGMQGSNRTCRGKLNPGVKATDKTGTGSGCCAANCLWDLQGKDKLPWASKAAAYASVFSPEELTNQTQTTKHSGRNLFTALIR